MERLTGALKGLAGIHGASMAIPEPIFSEANSTVF
jgi:hypothetical protein